MAFMRWIQQLKDRLRPLLEGVAGTEATAAHGAARTSSTREFGEPLCAHQYDRSETREIVLLSVPRKSLVITHCEGKSAEPVL